MMIMPTRIIVVAYFSFVIHLRILVWIKRKAALAMGNRAVAIPAITVEGLRTGYDIFNRVVVAADAVGLPRSGPSAGWRGWRPGRS